MNGLIRHRNMTVLCIKFLNEMKRRLIVRKPFFAAGQGRASDRFTLIANQRKTENAKCKEASKLAALEGQLIAVHFMSNKL